MELGTQVGKGRCPAAEVLRHRTGLQAAQPQPHPLRHGGAGGLQQINEALPGLEILAPGGDLDTREDDLPVSGRRQFFQLTHRLRRRQGAHPAPGVGNDAVRAEVHAPVLDFQKAAGPVGKAAGRQHLELPAGESVVQGLRRGTLCHGLLQQVHKGHPVSGACHQVRPQLPGVVLVGLGIAAADGGDGLRVLPADPVEHLAGLLVADRRDGAAVDDIGIRRVGEVHDLVSPAAQLLLHGLGLELVDLAAQGVNGNFHGISLHFV